MGSLSYAERLAHLFPSMQKEVIQRLVDEHDFDLRCSSPGIIESFDSSKQTVNVQLVIKELVYLDVPEGKKLSSLQIPLLQDVPIILPRAGGFVITLPIQKGDECFVFFADTCIDSWWQNGASDQDQAGNFIAQEPMSRRRHDLSDGFAILGTWSQPNVLTDYATDALEIRTDDGQTKISIQDGVVTIFSDSIKLGSNSGLYKLITDQILTYFNNHTHLYNPGPGDSTPTGVPVVPLTDVMCATTDVQGK